MPTNGTTYAANHLAERLRMQGHTVRIVTAVPPQKENGNIYVVKERSFLFFKRLINSHGMVLGKPNKKVLTDAIKGADLVHFFMPFALSRQGKKVADRLGVPSTAAFHLQPENISYNVGMKFITKKLYKSWRKFFSGFGHVHSPSEMIRDIITKDYGYTCNVHPISNGVNDVFIKRDAVRPEEYNDKYLIMMSGRLGHEKMQQVLLEAVGKSKYNDKIQVILCGKGPCAKKLAKLSAKVLTNPVQIKFLDRESLIDTINYCDLYVHTSEIESEAIACMEAFSCGKAPIISDSKTSATKQFALHPENLFKNRDTQDLANRIDWFIENPQRKAEIELDYIDYAKNFRLHNCMDKLIEVFYQEIKEHKERQAAAEKKRAKAVPMLDGEAAEVP